MTSKLPNRIEYLIHPQKDVMFTTEVQKRIKTNCGEGAEVNYKFSLDNMPQCDRL
jgi:hypothetical protein